MGFALNLYIAFGFFAFFLFLYFLKHVLLLKKDLKIFYDKIEHSHGVYF